MGNWGIELIERSDDNLAGMMLVAMPGMPDNRFDRSVVFLCSYDDQGAMGLIINQVSDDVTFETVIEQLELKPSADMPAAKPDLSGYHVHCGGPVEPGRGFVLHSSDYQHPQSLVIGEQFALSATVEVLEAIAQGKGPARVIFALGYAGWSAGQLDQEIQANGWLLAPADEHVIFDLADDAKWLGALGKLGIDPSALSSKAGHA